MCKWYVLHRKCPNISFDQGARNKLIILLKYIYDQRINNQIQSRKNLTWKRLLLFLDEESYLLIERTSATSRSWHRRCTYFEQHSLLERFLSQFAWTNSALRIPAHTPLDVTPNNFIPEFFNIILSGIKFCIKTFISMQPSNVTILTRYTCTFSHNTALLSTIS